jgi:septin family protein
MFGLYFLINFSAKVIGDFISEQFENYLKEELKIKRCLELYDDSRIHVCLYFISPTGHGYVKTHFLNDNELHTWV